MKKTAILLLFCLSLFAEDGDPYKGQTYFAHILHPKLGYNGAVFAKKYTKDEWKKIFDNGGKSFFLEFWEFKNELSNEQLLHIEAFAIKFAKDSDATPVCDN